MFTGVILSSMCLKNLLCFDFGSGGVVGGRVVVNYYNFQNFIVFGFKAGSVSFLKMPIHFYFLLSTSGILNFTFFPLSSYASVFGYLLRSQVESLFVSYSLYFVFKGKGFSWSYSRPLDSIVLSLGFGHNVNISLAKFPYLGVFANPNNSKFSSHCLVYGVEYSVLCRFFSFAKLINSPDVYKGNGLRLRSENLLLKVGKKKMFF